MIEAELPDGTVLEFPDGTADDVIDRVVRQQLGVTTSQPAPQERGFWHAVGDNVIGFDDGVQSFGEDLGTFFGMGAESASAGLLGDEGNALVAGMLPGGRDYDEAMDFYRGNEARFREDKPGLSLVADVGGAVLPGLGFAGAARAGANLATRAVAGGLTGLLGGATQGFMEGEGGLMPRIENSLVPAGLGAGIGLALPVAGQVAGAAYRSFGPGAARALRATERGLGINRTASELVSRAVDQDAPYAGRRVAEAGPNALNAQMGPNSTALLDFVASQPTSASTRVREGVNAFAEQQRQAFEQSLDRTMGLPEGVARRQREMMQSTAASRRAAYEAAYGQSIDWTTPAGQRLAELVDNLQPGDTAAAQRIMGREGARPIRREADVIGPEGDVIQRPMPGVEELDYATRALNDIGFPTGAGTQEAASARDLSRSIRRTLDELVPEYQAARAQGADVIANRNALDFGRTLLSREVPMDVAEDALADMTAVEQQFVASAVRDTINEMTANATRILSDPLADAREVLQPLRLLTNEAGERKLRALLGDQADEVIRSSRAAYHALSLRSNVGGNSATMPRQAWQREVDALMPRGATEALQEDGWGAAMGTAINQLAGDPSASRLARQQEMLDAVGRLLMQPMRDPNSNLPAIRRLPGLLAEANRNAGYVADDATRLGGLLGAIATQRTAEPRRRREPLRMTITPGG